MPQVKIILKIKKSEAPKSKVMCPKACSGKWQTVESNLHHLFLITRMCLQRIEWNFMVGKGFLYRAVGEVADKEVGIRLKKATLHMRLRSLD